MDSSIRELGPADGAGGLHPELRTGLILGDFKIQGRIGGGGMGEVYLAEQVSLPRQVALKILRPAFALSRNARLRFRREAEITAALDHPHIVPIIATGEDHEVTWLAMKLLSGPSLDRLGETRSPREIATLGSKVASALQVAHDIGIIHRDIKPANILLDRGEPVVVDFGLARQLDQDGLTEPGGAPGTLAYMAPELLARSNSSPDALSDVYGLAATLYELVAGNPPFQSSTMEGLITDVLLREPRSLGLSARDRDLEVILLRGLDKEPRKRPGSAAEFGAELDRWLAGEPIKSRPVGTLERAVKLVRRHRSAALILGGLLLVLAVIAAILGRRIWLESRAFQLDLSNLRSHLEVGNTVSARDILTRIKRGRESHPEVMRAQAEVQAIIALEALAGAAQLSPDTWDLEAMSELARRLDAPLLPRSMQVRRTAVLGMIAAVCSDESGVDLHGHALELDTDYRGIGRALRGVLSGDDWEKVDLVLGPADSDLPTSPKTTAELHLLRAMVLRAVEAPLDRLLPELERCCELDPTLERGRRALAGVLVEQGRIDAARRLYQGLTESTSLSVEAELGLARWELLRGNFDACRALTARAIEHARLARWPEDWLPLLHLQLNLSLQTRNQPEFEALVTLAERRFATEPTVLLLRGYEAASRRDFSASEERFRDSVAASRRQGPKARGKLALLHTRIENSPFGQQPLEVPESLAPQAKDQLVDFLADADSLLVEARGVSAASVAAGVLAIRGDLLRYLGRRSEAWVSLLEAVDSYPPWSPANLKIISLVAHWNQYPNPEDSSSIGPPRQLAAHGYWATIRLLETYRTGGESRVTRDEAVNACVAGLAFAYFMGTDVGCRQIARRGVEILGGEESAISHPFGVRILKAANEGIASFSR